MTNPFYDPYRILSEIYAEGAHLKIALAHGDIEELHRARTVKTVYGVLEYDGYFSLCISSFTQKSPKQSARILLKIALYWLLVLKKPRYMVTDTAVDLCKKLGKGGMAGFVNAFLRAFNEEKVTLPAGAEGLAVKSNFPLFAVNMALNEYGSRAEKILTAHSHGVTVRFERGAEKYLTRPHIATPFENVYVFENFARDEGFDAGDYTFQSVGSVAIAGVVEPCNRLLDACAAPGGKSVLLSKKCGEVTACELYPHRVELITAYAKRMGVTNVHATQKDSSEFDPAFEGRFDGVLCDVPCSGFGTVSENPDLPLKKTQEAFEELLPVQARILETSARYVKQGGCLYYSTCSIFRAENDGAIAKFLAGHSEFEEEKITSPLSHEVQTYGLQFLPDAAFGAGFYVAKLRRKG